MDFVIIGGVAAVFHGGLRTNLDLDICYSRTSANLRNLVLALAPFHPRPRGFASELAFVWDEETLRNDRTFTLQTDLGAIDLRADVAGVGVFDRVKARSIQVDAFGRRVAALDLAALIAAKRATGRGKDLAALAELEGLLEAGES